MKKISVLFLALFIVTCDNGAEDVLGCTDTSACNYSSSANVDDESCSYANEYYNCEGSCINDSDSDGICDENENTSWVFVANEGSFGASNGTISMIDDNGNVFETNEIGDIVQSLEVYNNKLIVIINNSHKIMLYDITEDGLSMPGIEIDTDGSSPRDLYILNDKVYFTNWNSQDVKVLNLFNYVIESSIAINGLPEDIDFDGQYLWVTIPHSDSSFGTGNTVSKIDPNSNTVIETIEVGNGPQQIAFDNGDILISRTYYDASFNAFHGAAKIGSDVITSEYGAGTPCGGAILKHQNVVYRSYNGGLAEMNADLSLNTDTQIGNFQQWQVYHIEEINGNLWFALTDYADYNEVKVLDSSGSELSTYNVGQNPGDFATWSIND